MSTNTSSLILRSLGFDDRRFSVNVAWNILGNVAGKLLGPLFQLLIARLLLPTDYGAFAIAMAWLAAFEVWKDWGLTHAAIVRRGEKPDTSLQFTIQIVTASAFFAVSLAVAPFGASYFAMPSLRLVLPLVAGVSLVNALGDPVLTRCLIEQNYKRLALRQLVAPAVTGATGLYCAYHGYGVYSLAFGLLAGQGAGALALMASYPEVPRLALDLERLRDLMTIGKHIVLQRFFGFLVGHADSFIVAQAFGSVSVGLYRMGSLMAFIVPTSSVSQVEQVVFTDVSSNHAADHVRKRYHAFTITAGSILLAYAVAVVWLGPALIPLVLGPEWVDVVPYVQIFAVTAVTGHLTPLNTDLAKVLGFAGAYTRFTAVRSIATVIVLIAAARYSPLHVVAAWAVVGLAAAFVNDIIFYAKQDIVRPTPEKVVLVAAAWALSAWVILGAFS